MRADAHSLLLLSVCALLAACPGPSTDPDTRPEPTPPTIPAPEPEPEPSPELTVAVEPTWNPLARRIQLTLVEPGPAVVACRAVDDPDSERHLLEVVEPAAAHTLDLAGLRAETHYTCRAAVTDRGAPVPFDITTEVLDGIVPTAWVTGDPLPGYVLAAYKPDACSQTSWLMILDSQGVVRWRWALPDGTQVDVEALLDAGEIVWAGGRLIDGVGIVDPIAGETYRATLPTQRPVHHDGKRLTDGRLLTLDERMVDGQGGPFVGFGLQVHDPTTGTVDFDYDSADAVRDGVLQQGFLDPWHANSVDRYDDPVDGPQYIVSLCYGFQVLAISETTGRVSWVFGEGGDFQLLEGRWPECQHGLEFDGQRLLAYDNGLFSSQSSVVEYSVDLAARTARETWRWTEPGWFEETLGDVDRLPDGSILVTRAHPECWSLGSPGAHSELIRVDPSTNAELWRLTFSEPQDTVYRAEWLDGCAVFAQPAQCPTIGDQWGRTEVQLWTADTP